MKYLLLFILSSCHYLTEDDPQNILAIVLKSPIIVQCFSGGKEVYLESTDAVFVDPRTRTYYFKNEAGKRVALSANCVFVEG